MLLMGCSGRAAGVTRLEEDVRDAYEGSCAISYRWRKKGGKGGRGTLNGRGFRKRANFDPIPRGTKLRWLTGVAVRRSPVDVMDGDDCWLPSQSGLV